MKLLRILLFVFLNLSLFFQPSFIWAREKSSEKVVAIAAGKTITRQEIVVDSDLERKNFCAEYNREPTEKEISQRIFEIERLALIDKITRIIYQKAIKDLAITITKEEANAKLRDVYPGLKENPDAILEKEVVFFRKLSVALREALRSPEKQAEIFKEKLQDIMNFETWQGALKEFNSLEKIEEMENSIPKNVEDIYISANSSMKILLRQEKLRTAITKDIKVTDEEVKKVFEKNSWWKWEKGTRFEDVKEEIKKELLDYKKNKYEQQWWEEQYKKANIKIIDERFKDLEEFFTKETKSKNKYIDTGN